MDLDEWEILPRDGFIDLHQNGNDDHISQISNPKSVIDMNYFQKFIEPIHLDEKEIQEDQSSKQQHIRPPKPLEVLEAYDQVTISQIFFKKMKETEFVDMKMDSPKSQNRGILPQIDVGTCQFEEKDGKFEEEPSIEKEKESNFKEEEVKWEDNNGGLNIWKWAMTGIGAVFSFGFVAASVSLIVLGNRSKEHHSYKKPELHFQIYTHDKRMKQVVKRAKRLNEAIAVVTGAPLTRAHITIGGYYEGL